MEQKRRAFLSFSAGFETRARHDEDEVQREALLVLPPDIREVEPSDEKARRLLAWFKQDFFTWVNSPDCTFCHSAQGMQAVRTRGPQSVDEQRGLASVVEVYICNTCTQVTSFPRFNHPLALFRTRSGRCGEWANAFCALAIASGFQTRYVLDLTDHVWAEVFSPEQGRWIHCDPCENAFDAPLMYEAGWNKQLSFVFGYETGGKAVDVTRRYSRRWDGDMIVRRAQVFSSALANGLALFRPTRLVESEVEEFRICVLETSLKKQVELKPEEEVGRISGSAEWKAARGELGETKRQLQAKFREYVAQGLPPNQAAARALQELIKSEK